jgi:uncharacterized membrane protein YecN with MAPEG domain
MILQVTLSAAAAAALMAMWLGMRVGRVRMATKVAHGDAGEPLLLKRMRAQANFVEYTPFVLVLIAAIELSGRGGHWLTWVAAIYFLARIAHAFGMDNDTARNPLRGIGIGVTMLTLLGLGAVAALTAGGAI